MDGIPSYQGLLGWLLDDHVEKNCGKGTFTIRSGAKKIILPLFPTQYHSETQDDEQNSPLMMVTRQRKKLP